MLPGQIGTITEIDHGHGLVRKLCSMGIVPGKKIMKVSQISVGEPIVIRIDEHDLALGGGIASRIEVRMEI